MPLFLAYLGQALDNTILWKIASISGESAALSNGTGVEEGALCHGRRVGASGNLLNINYR